MQGIAYKINGEPRLTWPREIELLNEWGEPTGETTSNINAAIAQLPPGVEYELVDENGAAAWWAANQGDRSEP